MDNRVKKLYDYTLSGEHHKFRKRIPADCLLEEFKAKNLNAADRTTKRLLFMLKSETPIVLKDEKISYFRTIENLPDIFTPEEAEQRSKTCSWDVGNICPDYITTIKTGLDYQKERCIKRMETADEEQKRFLNRVIESIDAIFELSERYRLEAQKQGNDTVADILSRIPHKGAKTFNEALQFFRILHFALWCEGSVHNGIGRFDCYMYEYWKRDLENGVCTYDEIYNLLLEFFLSFNCDNDLYPGVQRGDNGQSMMLGGVDREGNHVFNDFSEACLKASGEIMMIDPKINLRVDKNTPKSVFDKGTELTKKGLGFPQYSNDDVVIDGLVKPGYELADARAIPLRLVGSL